MEPEQGKFDFEWLADAADLLGRHGVYTILGTPTAAPPAWIIEQNPEILPVNSNGQRMSFGGRHHDCQSNKTYREHIRRFVTAMAERFKCAPRLLCASIAEELFELEQHRAACGLPDVAFSQEGLDALPFSFTLPLVKMGFRNARRRF
jgi:beta-galactosidase